jgi:sugar phosphate isomerase/epimerase
MREERIMKHPIIMHITYCEQGQTIDDICRKAVAWGFDGVEFRRRRIGVDETSEAYLDALEAGVHASGLRHVLFGYPGPLLTRPDPKDRECEVKEAIAFYRHVAERFRVRTVNLLTGGLSNPDPTVPYVEYTKHGSFVATDEQWDWQVKGCRELADGLAGVDIRFAFETHMVYLHDTVAATKKLVTLIDRPSIGVNLDYGNIVDFAEHPSLEECLQSLKGMLHYVHLKNSSPVRGTAGRVATSLADGEINTRQLLRLLAGMGYEGPLCLEGPRPGDREWFAQQDLAYLKSLLAEERA